MLPSSGQSAPSATESSTANRLDADFRLLFDRDFSYVWHSLRRLGVSESDCDDVANEVFVRVHQRFHEYDPGRPSRPWLFAFCARLASDYRKLARHRREAALDSDSKVGIATNGPEELTLRREACSLVLDALDALDDERRQVFVLHEIEERPIPEVAEMLSINIATAYTRLRAARQTFTEAARRLQARGGNGQEAR
jgi:RNA polymerase sigma-70 factor (ECF subfamily)